MPFRANPGKKLIIDIHGKKYFRYPIKTPLITPQEDDPVAVIKKYAQPFVGVGKSDILFISEKVISIMQGRSYHLDKIKPSPIAKWLSKHVYKNPAGIGLASPQTMQLAIEEAGLLRILFAAAAAFLTKPLGIRGVFYMIAGDKARSIDGAVSYAIPPYNEHASKGPAHPQKIVQEISHAIGIPAAIVDANDLGVRILGASRGVNKKMLAQALKDNPLGQSDESTPLGVLRPVKKE